MSHTLADLATFLPPDFLTADMDHKPPYDFASSSESESDDDDLAGLTRRFTRSVSFQERPKIPYHLQKKRVFSGSPESILNWNVSGHTQARSSPTTPFGRPDEDSLDRIYVAAEQVARMKLMMKMKMHTNTMNDAVFAYGAPIKAPRPLGASIPHHHNLPPILSENEHFIRQQHFRRRVSGAANYDCGGRCGTGGPLGFRDIRPPAWPSVPVENQLRQQPVNGFVVPPVIAGVNGGCARGNAVVKKERAGTGVFLPRNYCNVPPESKKTQTELAPSFNKNMDPMFAQPPPQTNIRGGFAPQYPLQQPPHHFKREELAELVMARRNALMLAQQRRAETRMGQAEVVLPQEWTY